MHNASNVVGHLHDDLTSVAGAVQRRLGEGNQTVWAEDDGRVYSCSASDTGVLPAHWIAGTFGMGQPLIEIEDDLRALLRERSKDWIVD